MPSYISTGNISVIQFYTSSPIFDISFIITVLVIVVLIYISVTPNYSFNYTEEAEELL